MLFTKKLRTMFKTFSLPLVLLIASTSAFALGFSDAQMAAQKHTDQTIAALAKMTDADSLAAAGLMSVGNNSDPSLPFLARATAAAPDRADLLCDSEVAVSSYLASQATPPYQYISNSCKGDRLQQSGVTEVCRGVAKAFQNGDTYLTEMIGVAIAKRVWPEDSPEWKAAAEERRVYEYRSKLYPKLEPRALTHPEEYLTLCAQNRREQEVFAAQLTAAGYDPNPPAQ